MHIIEDLAKIQNNDNNSDACDPLNIYGIPSPEMTPMVRRAVTAMHNEIISLKNERIRLTTELRHALALADTDPLTGILNRRAFEREMVRAVAFARRINVKCTLLFFDINDFKKVNDTYGHDAGDAVIKEFAKCLQANLRRSDVLGRIGGDEFMALLVKANEDEAMAKSKHLNNLIDEIRIPNDLGSISINCTIGVHCIGNDEKIADAIKNADKAMYASKLNDKDASF